MAPCKETNFLHHEVVDGRLQEYLEHFAGASDERIVGEISTRYLASVRAPARVASLFPEAAVLVSLRDPVRQAYSHYWHLRRQNFHQWTSEDLPQTFDAAIERYPDRILEPARYGKHLTRWLEHVGRDRMHVIRFEDIETVPGEVLRRLYGFLDVDARFEPGTVEGGHASSRRGVSPRSDTLGRVHSVLHDRLNRYAFRPLKRLIGTRRAVALKDRLGLRQAMERVFMRPGYPPMPGETEAGLRRLLADEVEQLSELLGQDFSAWVRRAA